MIFGSYFFLSAKKRGNAVVIILSWLVKESAIEWNKIMLYTHHKHWMGMFMLCDVSFFFWYNAFIVSYFCDRFFFYFCCCFVFQPFLTILLAWIPVSCISVNTHFLFFHRLFSISTKCMDRLHAYISIIIYL